MKRIFTLFACTSLIAAKSFSQISESFETQGDFTNLINQCWSFTTVSENNAAPIAGAGSVSSQLNSTSQIMTPFLNIGSSLTINFDYQRVAVSGGSRTLKILLVDTAGVQTLLDNIALNDASLHSYSNTFTNGNTPGIHFPMEGKIMFQFSNNVSVTFDNLTISANYFYTGGCPPAQSPLPVMLMSFQGNMNNGKVNLQWSVAQNEEGEHFEIQRSVDGKTFETAGIVMVSSKYGTESYTYSEVASSDKSYYRLEMVNKNGAIRYSKILAFQSNAISNSAALKIINNPATDKLTLSFSSASNQIAELKVYDMAGRLQIDQKINVYQGSNLISLQLSSTFKTGMYAVEVSTGSDRQAAKFVKQ
ncbi:MAG TPA: T9SS type A sorting domain-containing protein [Chitinophagaceae bacterium]|nr:T9SS type A sorting domain-containing protein [Chitinophagaceae bacterium]